MLANFLSYIVFLQAHKWVILQYNEPLQVTTTEKHANRFSLGVQILNYSHNFHIIM
jgi:hypothetical protein